jgi:hypothetical protein
VSMVRSQRLAPPSATQVLLAAAGLLLGGTFGLLVTVAGVTGLRQRGARSVAASAFTLLVLCGIASVLSAATGTGAVERAVAERSFASAAGQAAALLALVATVGLAKEERREP